MPVLNNPHLVAPGDVFDRLTVVRFSHNDKRWRRHYLVRCACGAEKTVQGTLLRSGNTKSCGCLGRDVKRATRLPQDAGVINHIILQYKRHASDRGIAWLLSRETVDFLVRQPCYYCADPAGNITKTKNHSGFAHNGIDRLDSAQPYTDHNVVACCGSCNRAKGSMSADDFVSLANRIARQHPQAMADQWGPLLSRPANLFAGAA